MEKTALLVDKLPYSFASVFSLSVWAYLMWYKLLRSGLYIYAGVSQF